MHRLPDLVFAATVLLAGALLAGCQDRRPAETAAPMQAVPPIGAAPSSAASAAATNALATYLRGAEIQAETDAQRSELRRALADLQSMPAATLSAARYAGGDGQPAQRDIVQVLRAHLVPASPQSLELSRLLADRETEAGRAALRDTLAKLDPPASK